MSGDRVLFEDCFVLTFGTVFGERPLSGSCPPLFGVFVRFFSGGFFLLLLGLFGELSAQSESELITSSGGRALSEDDEDDVEEDAESNLNDEDLIATSSSDACLSSA